MIDFLALWCGWRKPQMDELAAVLEEKVDEIVILSVDVKKSETNDDVINTFGDYVEKWTFVLGNYNEDVSSKYKVTGISKLVIYNRLRGKYLLSRIRINRKKKLIQKINKANIWVKYNEGQY